MDQFTIRLAKRDDAPAIYAIHKTSLTTLCQTHYPLNTLERWIARKSVEGYYPAIDRGEMFVCESGVTAVGFGHAIPGEVVAVFVHPSFAGQGIGKLILNHALQCAKSDDDTPIKLIATLNAEAFYVKHGFKEVRRYSEVRDDLEFPVVEMEKSK